QARADVRDLLADANQRHADVMEMLQARRSVRAFRVEQPSLAPLSNALQIEAINTVPGVLAALDTLDRVVVDSLRPLDSWPVIGARFADRVAAFVREHPPMAQVVVTLHSHPAAALRATNDETLAASNAVVSTASDSL